MSEAVGRLQTYIAARKKQKQLDKAWIHWINPGEESQAELRSEDIEQVLKQRAELLEALNEITRWIDPTADDAKSMQNIAFAATIKAEK